jgi:DNA excision repair protein ERCC-4
VVQPFADLTGTINQTDLQSKLVLLTLSFPRLKIIWSSSPYHTAEVFEELKKNHEEPDPLAAVRVGLDPSEQPGARVYNQAPQELLRSVPGVTAKNIWNLMVGWENVREISRAEEERLMEVVGPEAGRQIYGFFNRKLH